MPEQQLEWQTLKMEEGDTNQRMQAPLEAEKGKEKDFPLRAFGRNQPCWYLDFSPVKLIL